MADSLSDYIQWKCALENFVVQTTKISSVYHFQDTLGEGTFGQVMLGTPKQLIPFSRDCAFADDVRISESQVVAGSNEQEKTLSKVAIKILSK